MEKLPTVFIDRDGTINVDAGYMNHTDNFHVYPFAAQAIRMLNLRGILAVVVTNQSGLARGFYTLDTMHITHDKMNAHLASQGAHVDGIYYCPHDPKAKVEEFRMECECRKPKAGMLEQAARELPIDINRTVFIGDKQSDIDAGAAFGSKTILVNTGYGKGEKIVREPDYRAENLLEAVNIALGIIG
jgi:D-glycero-D-manno-heptose 1,7-bisphosphate phosphatase